MYQTLLIVHFLGLASGVGTAVVMTALGARQAGAPADDAAAFMIRAGAITPYTGGGGLVLLILSGAGMLWLSEGAMAEVGDWWFRIKLLLVLVIAIHLGLMHRQQARARRGEDAQAIAAKMSSLGFVILMTSVLTIICAVLAFG